jgi:FKBP-type peptidyl-prolyl cis-trans isomerase
MVSCKKDDANPYLETWKQQNEKAFNDLAYNPVFTELRMSGTPGSIYYRVLEQGEGKPVFYNSRAEVYYKGWFVATNEDYAIKAGTVFDQRLFDDGVTFKLAISAQAADSYTYSQVIDGWKIALQYMVEGDKWEVWIPYRYAYGEQGSSGIPGFSTLAFEIELVKAIDPDEFESSTESGGSQYYDPYYYNPYYY